MCPAGALENFFQSNFEFNMGHTAVLNDPAILFLTCNDAVIDRIADETSTFMCSDFEQAYVSQHVQANVGHVNEEVFDSVTSILLKFYQIEATKSKP